MRPWGRGSPQISHNDIDYFRLKSLENQLVQNEYPELHGSQRGRKWEEAAGRVEVSNEALGPTDAE